MVRKQIKGRKGGSSNATTPVESPDSIQSTAKAKILLALGEGEFAGGLTDYLQSTNWVSNTTGIRIGMRTGTIEINGATAGQGRMSLTNERIEVYDQNNIRRVLIGKY